MVLYLFRWGFGELRLSIHRSQLLHLRLRNLGKVYQFSRSLLLAVQERVKRYR